jgi:RND family efflux transporter MFP subunit
MFRKVYFWVLLVVIVAVAAGGYIYYRNASAAPAEATETPVQTATVRLGNLVISATGTGTVAAKAELGVGFEKSGVVTEILVEPGDEVKAGDVLARAQTDDTERSIAATIANAEVNVLKYQQALDDLLNQDNSLELAQAQLTLVEAQTNLEEMQEAREGLNYQRCLDSTIENYEAQYYRALNRYNDMLDYYKKNYTELPENDPDRLEALAAVLSAEEDMRKALANVNWCKGTATEAEIAEADANVALAVANLAAAQAQVDELQNPSDTLDVAIAEAQLASAQADLELAQEAKSVVELTAPIDGTVLSVDAIVGQNVGTGSIITVADMSDILLDVYMDESDMNSVGVGYPVNVVFDALPDQTFTGKIISVDPALTSMGGVSAVHAIAQVDEDSFAKPQNLPIGLSATVEVISSEADNALLVPVEALREIADGKYAVFLMQNGEPVLQVVEVGIMDYTYAEILSGLNNGDVVTTGIVETGQ